MLNVIHKMTSASLVSTMLAASLLVGCSSDQDNTGQYSTNQESPTKKSLSTSSTADTSDVLATVNGTAITQQDLDFTIQRTFSQADLLYSNEEVVKKVLQSLIAGEAMKQKILSELDSEQRAGITSKVKAYEQELYIKEYLSHYAQPQPVTVSMVKDYYQKNPDQFGGIKVKQVEIIRSVSPLSDQDRQSLLLQKQQLEESQDWKTLVTRLSGDIVYERTESSNQLLDKRLNQVIQQLELNRVSTATFIEGNTYFARVVSEKQLPPKPLSEVNHQIRKMLSPQQVRQAVKKASDEVVAQAKIEYR